MDWGRVVQEVVDSQAVEEAAAKFDGVVHVQKLELSYGQDGLAALEKAISEHEINRVVVAGYSPRTHGRIFAEAIRKPGLTGPTWRWPTSASRTPWCTMTIPTRPRTRPSPWCARRWPGCARPSQPPA